MPSVWKYWGEVDEPASDTINQSINQSIKEMMWAASKRCMCKFWCFQLLIPKKSGTLSAGIETSSYASMLSHRQGAEAS